MANPLPEEKEMFKQIEDEEITVPRFIWRTMYLLLGDYLSSIELYASCCIEENQSMELNHAKEVIEYNKKINDVYHKILYPERIGDQDNELLQKIKEENVSLHKIILKFFTNYLGNDLQNMNFLVGDYIDDKKNIPVQDVERILKGATEMKIFLDKLLKATKGSNI